MDEQRASNDKGGAASVELKREAIQGGNHGDTRTLQTYYKPATDEEKAIDRRVNLKLDICVVVILAINFIVSPWLTPASAYSFTL